MWLKLKREAPLSANHAPQVWLRTLANLKVGGSHGTFSRHPSVQRHPGWESLVWANPCRSKRRNFLHETWNVRILDKIYTKKLFVSKLWSHPKNVMKHFLFLFIIWWENSWTTKSPYIYFEKLLFQGKKSEKTKAWKGQVSTLSISSKVQVFGKSNLVQVEVWKGQILRGPTFERAKSRLAGHFIKRAQFYRTQSYRTKSQRT